MIVPPALTWTCLMKEGPSYVYDSAPGWFLQMLGAHQGDAHRVRVSWGLPARGQRPDLSGQVIVNARPSSDELQAQGFGYVRRFAVLPSLRRARWFVPLDSGAVASGAFDLYTPARASARIKQLTAKALARSGLAVWYRDQVTIASRELPPVETAIRGLFPDTDVRLALSAGAPEPAKNRKPSLAVLDPAGNIIAVGKMAMSPLARRIAEHEAMVLKALRDLPTAQFQAPRLLLAEEVDGKFLTVQSALCGTAGPAHWSAAHERFLASLHCGSHKPAACTAMIRSLRARLPRLPVYDNCLQLAFDEILATLDDCDVPATIVHGDFAPWNLRQHGDRISAFDWEYAQLDGLPLIDQTHFVLQVGYLLDHWTDKRAATELMEVASLSPLGLTCEQARALQGIYLIDMLARLIEEGYDPNDDMLAWYRRLLRRVSPAAKEVMLV